MTRQEFAEALYLYSTHFNASVTSYGRTLKRNTSVGGHPHSKHMTWLGADVIYDVKPTLSERRAKAKELAIRLVPEPDHDHLQA